MYKKDDNMAIVEMYSSYSSHKSDVDSEKEWEASSQNLSTLKDNSCGVEESRKDLQ